MNPTFERILKEKEFLRGAEAADTLDKQIAFCKTFLEKNKSLAEDEMFDPEKKSFPDRTIHVVGGKIDFYRVRADITTNELLGQNRNDMIREAVKGMKEDLMSQIVNSGAITFNEFFQVHTDSNVLYADIGVYIKTQKEKE